MPRSLPILHSAVGAPIAEIPTLPPSVPGLRLHQALVRTLEGLGGRVESNMEAVDFGTEGDKLTWVATASSARPLRHRAHAYLLATAASWGAASTVITRGRSWETVFNLPLALPGQRAVNGSVLQFLDPSGHPIFQGACRSTRHGNLSMPRVKCIYDNLWAAGNLLAHADAIRTRSREGLAMATGVAAEHNCERQL